MCRLHEATPAPRLICWSNYTRLVCVQPNWCVRHALHVWFLSQMWPKLLCAHLPPNSTDCSILHSMILKHMKLACCPPRKHRHARRRMWVAQMLQEQCQCEHVLHDRVWQPTDNILTRMSSLPTRCSCLAWRACSKA